MPTRSYERLDAAFARLLTTGDSGRNTTPFIIACLIVCTGVGQTMWLYAAFNVAAWIFIWRRMPELTGRSLEQIEAQLRDGKFKPDDFAKRPSEPAAGASSVAAAA